MKAEDVVKESEETTCENIDEAAAAEETKEAAEGETAEATEEAAEAAEDAPEEAEEPAGKKDKKDQQIEELNDKYRRLFAEFDNFRKRTELEKAGMFAEGEKTVLTKVLPLIDNFERALGSLKEEEKETAFAQGVEKVYKSFMDQMKELGVAPIEAKDHEFDANLHNAVMHIEDESVGENMVVEEFQKGYMFKDKVLRYSMVKVAN